MVTKHAGSVLKGFALIAGILVTAMAQSFVEKVRRIHVRQVIEGPRVHLIASRNHPFFPVVVHPQTPDALDRKALRRSRHGCRGDVPERELPVQGTKCKRRGEEEGAITLLAKSFVLHGHPLVAKPSEPHQLKVHALLHPLSRGPRHNHRWNRGFSPSYLVVTPSEPSNTGASGSATIR